MGVTDHQKTLSSILFVAVSREHFPTHYDKPFSELAELAAIGASGFFDAVKLDKDIYTADPKNDGQPYKGGTFGGYDCRARLQGFAIFRKGEPKEFGRDDVAALYIQGWIA